MSFTGKCRERQNREKKKYLALESGSMRIFTFKFSTKNQPKKSIDLKST
jgi:hypothetical protein